MLKQILYFCMYAVVIESAKLPKTWKTCKKNDAKQNDCLKVAIQEAIRDLAPNGKPSLGVMSIDPFHIDSLAVDNKANGPVSIRIDFSDLDLIGLKDINIEKTIWDWKDVDIQYSLPKLVLKGNYKINGKILLLPITGEGRCEVIFGNVRGDARLKFNEIAKDDTNYYVVESLHFTMDKTDSIHFQFNNLFNGDKTLGDNMNLFVNENSKEVLKELNPAISRGFGAAFKSVANRLFSKVPINEINS